MQCSFHGLGDTKYSQLDPRLGSPEKPLCQLSSPSSRGPGILKYMKLLTVYLKDNKLQILTHRETQMIRQNKAEEQKQWWSAAGIL